MIKPRTFSAVHVFVVQWLEQEPFIEWHSETMKKINKKIYEKFRNIKVTIILTHDEF